MSVPLLERLREIPLSAHDQARLRLASPRLTLARLFPYEPGRAGLEFVAPDGTRIAAQWFAESGTLERVAAETAATAPQVPSLIIRGAEPVLLQPGGADRKLVG